MSSTLSWQLPSPEPHRAARRYLLGRRDCLAPSRTAVVQHPRSAALAPLSSTGCAAQHSQCSRHNSG